MKKAMLIVNPSSGKEKATELEGPAKERLETHFDSVEVKHTEKAGDATRFAREAAESGFDSVFVMGGDGTVNEGISGLAEMENRPNFGFFPLGTVNDLARALGIPLKPEEAIDAMRFDTTEPLDIGKIESKKGTSYFMNVVAIGSIPEAVMGVDSKDKSKMGSMAYFVAGFKQLAKQERYHFEVKVDGEEMEIESSTLVIGSTNSIGGFEQLLPRADTDDGKLHLIYLKDRSILDTIRAIPDLLKGVRESTNAVGYAAFEQLEVAAPKAEKAVHTNVDGDEGPALPIKISVLPAHLSVYTTGE